MKKKKKTSSPDYRPVVTKEDKVNRALQGLKHRGLQRECIVRGMTFQEVVDADHWRLATYFYDHFEDPEDLSKLTDYDTWMEAKLEERGHKKGDVILSPSFRFGFAPDLDQIGTIQTPGRPRLEKPVGDAIAPPAKREVDTETGVVSGTKKNLTYQLTDQGLAIDEIIDKVVESFPQADPKSIKIWYKRRLKENLN